MKKQRVMREWTSALYQKLININYNQKIMNRQSWSNDEDNAIIKLVKEYGMDDWTKIAAKLRQNFAIHKRTGKQCRERWYNHLNPTVNKLPWTKQEEEQLFELHRNHGNRWKDISKKFIGRTDNDIKNHFYSTLRRSLRRLNKILGEKNSTTQMRQIKPSVLSTIMYYIYERQKIQQSSELVLSLKDLPILIFQFANFKPIKNNLKNSNFEEIRLKTNQIFNLITNFNRQYEQNKAIRHQIKAHKRREPKKDPIEDEDQLQQLAPQSESQNDEHYPIKIQYQEEDLKYNYHIKSEIKQYDDSEISKERRNKLTEKTQFSLNQQDFIEIKHQENNQEYRQSDYHLPQSPKHHRRISLQADEMHDLQFNQPEEPSQMILHDNVLDPIGSAQQQIRQTTHQQSSLIDELMDHSLGPKWHSK